MLIISIKSDNCSLNVMIYIFRWRPTEFLTNCSIMSASIKHTSTNINSNLQTIYETMSYSWPDFFFTSAFKTYSVFFFVYEVRIALNKCLRMMLLLCLNLWGKGSSGLGTSCFSTSPFHLLYSRIHRGYRSLSVTVYTTLIAVI